MNPEEIKKTIAEHIEKKLEAFRISKEADEILNVFHIFYDDKIRKLIDQYANVYYKGYTDGPSFHSHVLYDYSFLNCDEIWVDWTCNRYEDSETGNFTIPLHFLWDDNALEEFEKSIYERKKKELEEYKVIKKQELETKIKTLEDEIKSLESS